MGLHLWACFFWRWGAFDGPSPSRNAGSVCQATGTCTPEPPTHQWSAHRVRPVKDASNRTGPCPAAVARFRSSNRSNRSPARLVWQAAGRATGPTGPARGMTLAELACMTSSQWTRRAQKPSCHSIWRTDVALAVACIACVCIVAAAAAASFAISFGEWSAIGQWLRRSRQHLMRSAAHCHRACT